ncbi:MAG: hypothetical protein OEV87_07640, partial [Phycisphaerae bacterium]|nr:hypothetical protein [Phycisphaerae bacterium]
ISFAGMVSTPKKTVKPCHCYRTNPKSSLKYNTISSEHPSFCPGANRKKGWRKKMLSKNPIFSLTLRLEFV